MIKVWDKAVRIFHWSLVTLFLIAYFSAEKNDVLHETAGYGVFAFVIFRVIWGFVGGEHARFKDFIYHPKTTLLFLKDTIKMKAIRYIGHNPAGGAMVIALIFALFTITVTGIMMTTKLFWGVELVGEIHEFATHLTVALIALHIFGVIASSFEHKENLIKSMFTGKKRE
jgi:cytochrome b